MDYSYYYTFDLPVPYKSLMIYPVKIKDYYEFLFYASCLTIEKNSIRDPELAVKAISMSYFQYMMEVSNNENKYAILFDGLLRIILNKKEESFPIEVGKLKDGKPYFKIEDKTFYSEDFDNIRTIVSEQNMFDLPNEKIQKDVRDKINEDRKFRERINKNKIASFEEQLLALSMYSSIELDKVYNMTFRKFIMSIRRANHMIMSNIYLTASMSGFVTFKDKSVQRGWLADLSDYDKNKEGLLELQSVQSKINMQEKTK